MKYRMLAALTAASLTVLTLASCEQIGWQEEEEQQPYPVTVGNVTVEKQPRAVGSLSPALTRLLVDLGYQDRIVGYSDDDVIPDGVELGDLSELIEQARAEAAEAGSAAASAPSDSPAAGGETGSLPQSGQADGGAPESGESGDGTDTADEGETNETGGTEGLSSLPEDAHSSEAAASSEIAISIPEDWDGQTPLPKEPVYVGRMGTALAPDMVRIGILKPEILFTSLPLTKAQMDQLDSINIKVVVMPAITTFEELAQRVEEMILLMDGMQVDAPPAESGGEPVRSAATIAQELREELADLRVKLPDTRKSFLYLCGEDMLPATGDTLEGNLLSLLGENLAAGYTEYTVPEEALAAMDPDLLLYSAPLERAGIEQDERFQGMTAVAEGALLEVGQTALLEQTRGIVQTLRELAAQMYPGIDFSPTPDDTDGSGPEGGGSDGAEAADPDASGVQDGSPDGV